MKFNRNSAYNSIVMNKTFKNQFNKIEICFENYKILREIKWQIKCTPWIKTFNIVSDGSVSDIDMKIKIPIKISVFFHKLTRWFQNSYGNTKDPKGSKLSWKGKIELEDIHFLILKFIMKL